MHRTAADHHEAQLVAEVVRIAPVRHRVRLGADHDRVVEELELVEPLATGSVDIDDELEVHQPEDDLFAADEVVAAALVEGHQLAVHLHQQEVEDHRLLLGREHVSSQPVPHDDLVLTSLRQAAHHSVTGQEVVLEARLVGAGVPSDLAVVQPVGAARDHDGQGRERESRQ